MTLLARIREEVVLITLLAVWAAVVVYTFTRIPPSGQMEPGQIVFYVLMVVSVSVLCSFIPAIATMYGWYTGKKAWAVIIGAIPLPAFFILEDIVTSGHTMVWMPAVGAILYVTILSGIAGCAGYCAARRTKPCLAVAIALTGVWIFLLMHAIN